MKTAISLPDAVFEQADALAARLHVSRSQLYVMALEKLIKENRESSITDDLNAYIDKHGQPTDPVFLQSSHHDMRKVEW
jgi:metal-responsive CopG/Arc/MetJ family transcriptional regulator